MNPKTLNTSAQFFRAAASYLGLPPDQLVLGGGQAGVIDGAFRVSLELALTPDDLIGIVNRMQQLDKERAAKNLDDFLGKPRPGTTPAPGADVAYAEPASSEGVAGRKVAHVDVPEEQGDAALPASVWVRDKDLMRSQVGLASDTRNEDGPEYLLQVAMLTPEQRLLYGVAPAWLTSMWVAGADMENGQAALSSDYNQKTDTYLMQVCMLTDEQKAKYGVVS